MTSASTNVAVISRPPDLYLLLGLSDGVASARAIGPQSHGTSGHASECPSPTERPAYGPHGHATQTATCATGSIAAEPHRPRRLPRPATKPGSLHTCC